MTTPTVEEMQAKIKELEAKVAKSNVQDDAFVVCSKSKGKMKLGYTSLIDDSYNGKARKGLATVINQAVSDSKNMITFRTFNYTKADGTQCIGVGMQCWKADKK